MRTILIVDDQASFRSFARSILEADGYEIVGEAADGASAERQATALKPDVILLDVQLPDLDGFAVCERLSRGGQAPPIVLTSVRPVSSYRRRLAGSRARGFVAKSELSGAALEAILGPE